MMSTFDERDVRIRGLRASLHQADSRAEKAEDELKRLRDAVAALADELDTYTLNPHGYPIAAARFRALLDTGDQS